MTYYSTKHGGPFDRGGADYYYGRPFDPHWYPDGTYNGERIGRADMTMDEIEAYAAGYEEAEAAGAQKEW